MEKPLIILLWVLVMALAVVIGAGVAYWLQRRARQRRQLPVQDGETVYSALGHGGPADALDIDPIHEAEVYAAYGNKETALRVLMKAAAAAPEREDIRAKIEELRASE
jgi:hypothetical protein